MPTYIDNRYIYEFTAHNNWRYRLEILPRQKQNLTNHTTLTDYTITADMGVFADEITIESGFDAHPLGLPKTPAMKLKMNLDALTGATEWTDLRDCLLQPVLQSGMYDSSGDILTGGSAWTPIRLARYVFNTANIFTLRSDLGDSGATMSSATVVFQGGQRKTPTNKLELNYSSSFYEIDIYGIERVLLEQLPLGMLDIFANPVSLECYRFTLDQRSTNYQVIGEAAPPDGYHVYAMSLSNFISAANSTAKAMYRNLVRSNSANVTIAPFLGDLGGSDAVVQFYEQTLEDADNPVGADITSESDMYFIYAVRKDGETLYHCLTDSKFLGKYSNFYDMYKEIAESTFSKRVFFNSDYKTLQCYCVPLWSKTTSDTRQEIALSDIEIDTAKLELGGMMLRAARTNLYSVGSDELDKTEVFDVGTDSESDWDVPTAWHNIPQATKIIYTGDYNTPSWASFRRSGAQQGELFYVAEVPPASIDEVLGKVHDYVELYDGAGNTFGYASIAYPSVTTIVDGSEGVSEAASSIRRIQGNFIARQQQTCLPFTLASAILTCFSGAGQSVLEYDTTRPDKLQFYFPQWIGDLWTTDVSGFKSYLSFVQTDGVLLESKIDVVKCTVSAKFLIKGDY